MLKKTLVRIEIALFIGDNKHLCFFKLHVLVVSSVNGKG